LRTFAVRRQGEDLLVSLKSHQEAPREKDGIAHE
jgi:hypothetical protein